MAKRKELNKGRGSVGHSNFFCSEYDDRVDQVANETNSREWDHSYNAEDVTADGKYLEKVDTFDIGGIQGRHIEKYSKQRRPCENAAKIFTVG